MGHIPWMIHCGKHFLDTRLELHILKGEFFNVTLYAVVFFFFHNIFPLFSQRKLVQYLDFSQWGILFSFVGGTSVGNFPSWVGRLSISLRCGSFRSDSWGLGTLLAGTLSFLLVKVISTKYCLQVTNIVSRSA